MQNVENDIESVRKKTEERYENVKKYKRLMTLLMAGTVAVSMSACGGSDNAKEKDTAKTEAGTTEAKSESTEALTKEEKSTLEKLDTSDNFKPNTSVKEKIFKKFKSFFD